MNIEEAIDKGFLNIEEEQASSVIDDLFDTEDAQTRLEQGIELMRTFVPDEKIPYVLDLSALILDANEELEGDQEEEHQHEE